MTIKEYFIISKAPGLEAPCWMHFCVLRRNPFVSGKNIVNMYKVMSIGRDSPFLSWSGYPHVNNGTIFFFRLLC